MPGYRKAAAFFLHIPTGRGGRLASPLDFFVSCFSRKFPDLGTPICLFIELELHAPWYSAHGYNVRISIRKPKVYGL